MTQQPEQGPGWYAPGAVVNGMQWNGEAWVPATAPPPAYPPAGYPPAGYPAPLPGQPGGYGMPTPPQPAVAPSRSRWPLWLGLGVGAAVLLLIVLVVAAIAIPVFVAQRTVVAQGEVIGQRGEAVAAAIESDLRNAQVAAEVFYTENQRYPTDAAQLRAYGATSSAGTSVTVAWATATGYCLQAGPSGQPATMHALGGTMPGSTGGAPAPGPCPPG